MDPFKQAESINSATELFSALGKMDPAEKDQSLLLQAMEVLGKTKILKQYTVLYLKTFSE